SALLGHGDGEARLGDRVHGRGDDGDVQADVAGDLRADFDKIRMDVGLGGTEENVIECEADFDGLGESLRRQRIASLDLVKVDATDDRHVFEYTFVAHVGPFE